MTRTVMALLFVAACSPAAPAVSQAAGDPSNPKAAEGKDPLALAVAAKAPLPAPAAHVEHEGHEGHDHGSASAAYVCPMHPEVTSDAPGLCPKCNMKLVPSK